MDDGKNTNMGIALVEAMPDGKGGWQPVPALMTEPEVTVRSFCEDWLRIRGAGLREGTKRLYQLTIERLIDHFGPTLPVSKVTPMAAEKFIASLRPERKEKKGKDLSAWTRQKMLRHCKTIFKKTVVWN